MLLHSTTTQARLRPRRRPSSSISTFLFSLYKSSNVSAGSVRCDAMSEMRKNPRKGHAHFGVEICTSPQSLWLNFIGTSRSPARAEAYGRAKGSLSAG